MYFSADTKLEHPGYEQPRFYIICSLFFAKYGGLRKLPLNSVKQAIERKYVKETQKLYT